MQQKFTEHLLCTGAELGASFRKEIKTSHHDLRLFRNLGRQGCGDGKENKRKGLREKKKATQLNQI